MSSCRKCVHKRICDLWQREEMQSADCFSSLEDDCSYFEQKVKTEKYDSIISNLEERAGEYVRQNITIPEIRDGFFQGIRWTLKKLIRMRIVKATMPRDWKEEKS